MEDKRRRGEEKGDSKEKRGKHKSGRQKTFHTGFAMEATSATRRCVISRNTTFIERKVFKAEKEKREKREKRENCFI